MKKWIKILIIIAIIIVIFVIGVEVTYHSLLSDCCSCCDDSQATCITACCKCNYNTFEKIVRIVDYFKD